MSRFEISLSKNDLEYIANGYDIKIKIDGKRLLKADEIVLKPAVRNDLMNPLLNYRHKIIDTDTGYGIAISRETSDKIILMQSTGFFDKNGKEIYEGDIVSIDTDEFDLLVVKYETGIYWLMDGEQGMEYLSDYYNYVTVVGNIHENQDIVEVKK